MIGTIFAIIIGALLLIAGIILFAFADLDFYPLYWFMSVIGTIVVMKGLWSLKESEEIKPMDVYQGNTTLQYTIVDGVVTDSTVVWKPYKE